MKKFEKKLLGKLSRPTDRVDSFTLKVRRYFTDVDGTIVNKNTVPPILKTKYPVYLFNKFDRDGAYKIANRTNPPLPGTFFAFTSVNQGGFDLLSYSGANNVKEQINTGDIVFVYTDDPNNPNFFIWLIYTIEERSFASILQNVPEKGLNLWKILYFTDSTIQASEQLTIVKENYLGVFISDNIAPLTYALPDYKQDDFIDILLTMKLSDYNGINTYFQFNTEQLDFDLKFVNI